MVKKEGKIKKHGEKEADIIEENKIQDSQDEKKVKEGIKKRQNRQIKIAVILMTVALGIIILTPVFYGYFFTKFDYINLEFQKTKLGQINFYSTRIPLVANAPEEGHLITNKEVVGYYSINFRSDPRKLESIKLNLDFNNSDEIGFVNINTAYISLDPEMKKCDDTSIALINFAGFLRDFAGLDLKSATSDENTSIELKIPYVTCKNRKSNTIINIRSGNETKIEKTGENCYELTYKDCEIIPVTEKLNLLVLEGYMKYFEEKKGWLDWLFS